MKKSMIIAAALMLLVSCIKNKDNAPSGAGKPDMQQPVGDSAYPEHGQATGSLRIDGRSYNVNARALYTGGVLMITLSDISDPSKPVNLTINMRAVTGPGTYSFSDATVVTLLDGSVTPVKGWESYYTDKSGKRVHAGGSVTITAGGIHVGQPLEGRVEGELLRVVNSTTGQVERVAVYGSFGVVLGG